MKCGYAVSYMDQRLSTLDILRHIVYSRYESIMYNHQKYKTNFCYILHKSNNNAYNSLHTFLAIAHNDDTLKYFSMCLSISIYKFTNTLAWNYFGCVVTMIIFLVKMLFTYFKWITKSRDHIAIIKFELISVWIVLVAVKKMKKKKCADGNNFIQFGECFFLYFFPMWVLGICDFCA